MTFTTHGHHIHGTILALRDQPRQVARCGGPSLCEKCGAESFRALNETLAIPTHTDISNTQGEKEDNTAMKTETYQRKTFEVQAVQVTEENFHEVAEWCNGQIITPQEPQMALEGMESTPKSYILVFVHRPLTPRQGQAHIGDWVLWTLKGFKVYTDAAFHKNFELRNQA